MSRTTPPPGCPAHGSRVGALARHLTAAPAAESAAAASAAAPIPPSLAALLPTVAGAPPTLPPGMESAPVVEPPVVRDPQGRMSSDPVAFLIEQGRQHPGCFILERSPKNRFVVVSDASMFEDVLTFDEYFGNPVTPNMSVNKNVFKIPVEQLEKYEQKAIGGLRQFILSNNNLLADDIARILLPYLDERMGEEGVMDLREFGTHIFWPMTQALFGDGASRQRAPFLKESFDVIDSNFGLALQGKRVQAVDTNVARAVDNFSSMINEAKAGGCPVGPLINFYDRVTDHADPALTAKFSTAAWWGGQGNTLPSTVWTFGLVLGDERTRRLAYEEVDRGPFRSQPDPEGHFDYETLPYLTAALKEALRLKTYSIAWRLVRKDCVLPSKQAGKLFKFKKGDLVGLHFAMRHMDDRVHPDPAVFRPERFLGTGAGLSPTINGHQYAFAPFSAGVHKCSGYGLAMLEIPVVMALVFRRYDMKLLDPLPGMNFKEAFGVVGPDDKPVRVQYKRRKEGMPVSP